MKSPPNRAYPASMSPEEIAAADEWLDDDSDLELWELLSRHLEPMRSTPLLGLLAPTKPTPPEA